MDGSDARYSESSLLWVDKSFVFPISRELEEATRLPAPIPDIGTPLPPPGANVRRRAPDSLRSSLIDPAYTARSGAARREESRNTRRSAAMAESNYPDLTRFRALR